MEINGYSQNKTPIKMVTTNDFLNEKIGNCFWINLFLKLKFN